MPHPHNWNRNCRHKILWMYREELELIEARGRRSKELNNLTHQRLLEGQVRKISIVWWVCMDKTWWTWILLPVIHTNSNLCHWIITVSLRLVLISSNTNYWWCSNRSCFFSNSSQYIHKCLQIAVHPCFSMHLIRLRPQRSLLVVQMSIDKLSKLIKGFLLIKSPELDLLDSIMVLRQEFRLEK